MDFQVLLNGERILDVKLKTTGLLRTMSVEFDTYLEFSKSILSLVTE